LRESFPLRDAGGVVGAGGWVVAAGAAGGDDQRLAARRSSGLVAPVTAANATAVRTAHFFVGTQKAQTVGASQWFAAHALDDAAIPFFFRCPMHLVAAVVFRDEGQLFATPVVGASVLATFHVCGVRVEDKVVALAHMTSRT